VTPPSVSGSVKVDYDPNLCRISLSASGYPADTLLYLEAGFRDTSGTIMVDYIREQHADRKGRTTWDTQLTYRPSSNSSIYPTIQLKATPIGGGEVATLEIASGCKP
jgi:hypothetical protein